MDKNSIIDILESMKTKCRNFDGEEMEYIENHTFELVAEKIVESSLAAVMVRTERTMISKSKIEEKLKDLEELVGAMKQFYGNKPKDMSKHDYKIITDKYLSRKTEIDLLKWVLCK